MANFCLDCNKNHFGVNYSDMAKLLPKEAYDDETGALCLCECCGPIVVDYRGKRISSFSKDCECNPNEVGTDP